MSQVAMSVSDGITKDMLKKVFEINDSSKDGYLQSIVDTLNEINKDGIPAYVKYRLNTEERLAHFFAQCYHEAGSKIKEGKALEENLSYQANVVYKKVENFKNRAKTFDNYKRAFEVGRLYDIETEQNGTLRAQSKKETLINQHEKALKKVKEKYGEASEEYKKITEIIKVRAQKTPEIQKFPDIEDLLENFNPSTNNSREFEKLPKANQTDQEGIGNLIYLDANRIKKLGNKGLKDGYNFRGRGMIQLTGKDNYTKFQNFYNQYNSQKKDFLEEEVSRDAIATDPKLAFLSAVWFWYENKLHIKAIPNNVEAITTIVNGGDSGLLDRAIAYYRIKNPNPHFTQRYLMGEAKKIRKRAGEDKLAFARRQIAKIKEIVQGQAQEGIFKGFGE